MKKFKIIYAIIGVIIAAILTPLGIAQCKKDLAWYAKTPASIKGYAMAITFMAVIILWPILIPAFLVSIISGILLIERRKPKN